MADQINIALLGSKFMGRAHSNAWSKVASFFDVDLAPVLHTVVGRNAEELAAFADRWGWQHASTDWEAAATADEIGLVDVGTPNNVHAEQAIAALEAGNDIAMICHHTERAGDAAARIAELSPNILMDAEKRLEKFHRKLPGAILWDREKWDRTCDDIAKLREEVPTLSEPEATAGSPVADY